MNKLLCRLVAVGLISTFMLPQIALADVSATALPVLNNADKADVTTSGSNMNIQINAGAGGVGTLNWNSFNVGKDAKVNYEFTSHNQTALNKVAATGGMSQIYGQITSSGCNGCGYEATGKVILINPNGILFGDGANVNLNSFTGTSFDGTYNKNTNELTLTKNNNSGDIYVLGGAKIHGDKNVTLAASNINTYAGSKITTNINPNVGDTAYGKVKLITADGVNFTYYNNGAVKSLSDISTSADKMTITLNGDINSGHIDVRNYSQNADSEINIANATLKATRAEKGNDGNIWLTASNRIIVDDTNLTTADLNSNSSKTTGGDVRIVAGKKVSVGNSNISSVGETLIKSEAHDVVVDNTKINSNGNVSILADKIASVQNKSEIKAGNGILSNLAGVEGATKNITIKGGERAQANNSKLTGKDVTLESDGTMVWTNNANIVASGTADFKANNGYLLLKDSIVNAGKINLTSKDSITSAKLAGSEFISKASSKMDLKSTGDSIILNSTDQFKSDNNLDGGYFALNLDAAKHIELNYENDLTVPLGTMKAGENINLISQNGSIKLYQQTKFESAKNININAAKDIKTADTQGTAVTPTPSVINLNGIKTNMNAGRDIDVRLTGVDNKDNGLIAQAGNNMTVTTDGTLSVSSLISGNDMTINANKVIAGKDYTKVPHLNNETGVNRSYIEVGGKFTSNVTEDNFGITASGELTNDGKYNQKHHIQYGEDEKILLINKRPADNNVTDPNYGDTNKGEDVDVVNPGDVVDSTVPSNPNPPTDTPNDNPNDNPNYNQPENPDDDVDCGEDGEGDTWVDETISTAIRSLAQATTTKNKY